MLKAVIASLDDAPDGAKDFYKPGTADDGTDGRFVLKVESVDGFALENVTGLKNTLGKEMTQRKALEKATKAFEGIDPERAREAISKYDEFANLDPEKEADKIAEAKFQAAKTQLLDKHTTDLAQKDARITQLTGAVDQMVRQASATQAIAEAKGSVGLLLPHVLAHTRVKETDDGKFVVEVVDQAGNVRIGDSQGAPMDLKGLVKEMRQSEEYARAFDGEGHSGTGKVADNPGSPKKGSVGGDRSERAAHFAQKYGLPAS